MKLPTIIKGTHPSVMRDSCQQKMNPITSPPTSAKKDSVYGPSASLAAPLITAVSDAIALVRTLD